MNHESLKKIIISAIFIAITIVLTAFIQIPIPSGSGYLNIGDGILMLGGLLLGPVSGFLIGGIGSGLADVAAGYAFYAPFTFIAKGLEGAGAAYIYRKTHNTWLSTIIGGLIMTIGYWFTDIILYNIGTATAALAFNLFQGLTGAIIASLLFKPICRALKLGK